MTAPILKVSIRKDIESKVDRVLRELGCPEPPLRLEDVRELLKLDRSYFTGDSDGVLRSTFSKLKRAGKQILKDRWFSLQPFGNLTCVLFIYPIIEES